MNFDNLKDQVSNLTLYDIKAGVRKVQNAVMNYTEMEAKVREATNNEPWGASTTLMQEIANGTYNYSMLNEIMPMIYKRFTDKAAEEWRQIYKGLQLLEFLVKNGSERVIDDARSHLSLLKMLKQFHFIDENGKDQGINVRNRAKELTELLSDVDRIRSERKKARTTRNKYAGMEGGTFGMGSSSGGERYGGFGNQSSSGYGGYSGGVYGDGGGFGGNTSDFQDSTSASTSRRDRFDEYNEYDEGAVSAPGRRNENSTSSGPRKATATRRTEPPKPKEPEVDLFSFDDAPSLPAASISAKSNPAPSVSQSTANDDDDFDDFQSATPEPQTLPKSSIQGIVPPASTSTTTSSTRFAAPQPVSGTKGSNIDDFVGFNSISPLPSASATPSAPHSAFSPPPLPQPAPQPSVYQAAQPYYFTSVQAPSSQTGTGPASAISSSTPSLLSPSAGKPTTASKSAVSGGGDAFGSIWSTASAGIKKTGTPNSQGPNLASMAKEKASAGIWGAPAASSQPQQLASATPAASSSSSGGQKIGGGLDDLLG
ncbi:MAG: hypothetical protein M1825_002977 [Sarcosagium campestre]|nr:MAG: hypothetical protein M1825_002977 [Sarcosagium campestre]